MSLVVAKCQLIALSRTLERSHYGWRLLENGSPPGSPPLPLVCGHRPSPRQAQAVFRSCILPLGGRAAGQTAVQLGNLQASGRCVAESAPCRINSAPAARPAAALPGRAQPYARSRGRAAQPLAALAIAVVVWPGREGVVDMRSTGRSADSSAIRRRS